MPRTRVRTTLAVLFACVGAVALVQSPLEDLTMLKGWQLVNAAAAAIAAVTLWRQSRFAWLAITLWTASTASMVWELGPLLDLPKEARGSLIVGSLAIVAMGGAAIWYARRAVR
jgi:hypothetical protein